MNKLEKARWRNIFKKAAKANLLLKKGFLILDHFGNKFNGFKYCKEKKYLYQGDNNCRVVWLGEERSGWDSALDVPIEKYNTDTFDKWIAVHPKNYKKI